jgi:hypothetical protein
VRERDGSRTTVREQGESCVDLFSVVFLVVVIFIVVVVVVFSFRVVFGVNGDGGIGKKRDERNEAGFERIDGGEDVGELGLVRGQVQGAVAALAGGVARTRAGVILVHQAAAHVVSSEHAFLGVTVVRVLDCEQAKGLSNLGFLVCGQAVLFCEFGGALGRRLPCRRSAAFRRLLP